MTDHKELTNEQLNKAVALKLGIEWHEEIEADECFHYCSCGRKFYTDYQMWSHLQDRANPDFCSNAKFLLEELQKRDEWDKIAMSILKLEVIVPVGNSHYKNIYSVSLEYILNPRLLVLAYLEWKK